MRFADEQRAERGMVGKMLSHYRLVEKIGEGGMGVVWKAEDTILGRVVAIKILPPDAARDENRRRMFLDEAKLASSLGHANIAQVHELGRDGKLDFIVMEYIEGKPLSRLLHGRPLPADMVANIGLQVALAVSRAHHKGLVHRDIKPANIMVTPEGDAKVVDFGLATLLERRDTTLFSGLLSRTESVSMDHEPHGRENRDRPAVAGTIPYMSPEQVRGERLDGRSDIFSFGAVLYEMTTGERPFTGVTTSEVVRELLKCQPRAPHEIAPKIPLDLDRIIQKALALRPAERYQTMDDLAVDLKRLGRELDSGSSPSFEDLHPGIHRRSPRRQWVVLSGVLGLITLISLAGWWAHFRGAAGTTARGVRSILISPMEVRGQAEGADYLGRAFAEAVAISLVSAPALQVLPVPTTGPVQPETAEFMRLTKNLKLDLLVSGALTRDGKDLNLTLTLVDPGNRRMLWGVHDTGGSGETARMAADASRRLIEHLGLVLPRRYEYFRYVAGSPKMTGSPDLLPAIGALRRHDGPESLRLTQRLLETFPDEYEAHVMRVTALVDAHNAEHSSPSRKALEQGLDGVRRIDPLSPIPDLFTAWMVRDHDGDLVRARTLTQALLHREDETTAFRAHALREHAMTLMRMDSLEAASQRLAEARQLDPANGWNYSYSAAVARRMNHLEEAAERGQQAVALEPGNWVYHGELAGSLAALNRWDEAIRENSAMCEISPTQANYAYRAGLLLRAGRREESQVAAHTAAKQDSTANGMLQLGKYWVHEGSTTEGIRCLRQAANRGIDVAAIRDDPQFEPLHGNPAFEAILRTPQGSAR